MLISGTVIPVIIVIHLTELTEMTNTGCRKEDIHQQSKIEGNFRQINGKEIKRQVMDQNIIKGQVTDPDIIKERVCFIDTNKGNVWLDRG